jgi:hypothetical protein
MCIVMPQQDAASSQYKAPEPSARQISGLAKQGPPMGKLVETNPLSNLLADLAQRTDALRGYL